MSFSSLITEAERPSANFLISVLCCYTLNVRSKSFRIYACRFYGTLSAQPVSHNY